MKKLDQAAIQLLSNRTVFEEIHQLKASFIALFAELANEIPALDLLKIHPASQGSKISKGNELQHCPYQVLDIIRDFDKQWGFNIRLLNWWGRGMFIFVYLGEHNERIRQESPFLSRLQFHGYLCAKTSSPWDYKNMIDGSHLETIIDPGQLALHLRQFHYLQLVKKIAYTEDFPALKNILKEEVVQILNFYRS